VPAAVSLHAQECDGYLQKALEHITQEDLVDRIEFRESPDDKGFLEAMQTVDIVLCLYLEIGQSAS
jgi:hypothetical protein